MSRRDVRLARVLATAWLLAVAAPAPAAPPFRPDTTATAAAPAATIRAWRRPPRGKASPDPTGGRTPRKGITVSVRVVPSVGPEGGPPPASAFALEQNAPNPFATTTTIRYAVPFTAPTRIAVYSVTGRCVATLVDATQDAGQYALAWDGRGDDGRRLGAGVYWYRIESGNRARTRRLVIR